MAFMVDSPGRQVMLSSVNFKRMGKRLAKETPWIHVETTVPSISYGIVAQEQHDSVAIRLF